MNGLPGGNYKVYLEGQDSTSPVAVGWTSTVQSASVEAMTEFAVQSSNYSAEYGQVLGGLYNFTTKCGTNQSHGSAYEELTNEALNAAQPWNHVLNRDRQSDYGFSVGGPVWIPKVYNGKNRTFFFLQSGGIRHQFDQHHQYNRSHRCVSAGRFRLRSLRYFNKLYRSDGEP